MNDHREARLVVIDEDGQLAGITEYRTVSLPWWQECSSLVEGFPELLSAAGVELTTAENQLQWAGQHVVLRILEAEHVSDGYMGGRTTHLVQASNATLKRSPLVTSYPGALQPQELRHPWAEPGGPAQDLDWVASQVEVTGLPVQRRTWNLSAVWSIPTVDGQVWLKCVPSFFQHEQIVLETLADIVPGCSPLLIAVDSHRLLMAAMGGSDGHNAGPDEQVTMIDTLVDIQVAAADRVEHLVEAGVPDMRSQHLVSTLTSFLNRVAPDDDVLQGLVAELPNRMDAVDRAGLADTLVHGDPHSGNCRLGTSPPVWFDWGDSFVGNPLLDLGGVHRMSPQAVKRWLHRWSDRANVNDLAATWETLRPIALARSAWVYQHFLDNIEPNERIYHHRDVPMILDEVRKLLTSDSNGGLPR